jgi:hypothetical protein
MARLSEADLDAIENRAAAASAGPWEPMIFSDRNPNDEDFIRVGGLDDSRPDMYVHHWLDAAQVLVPWQDIEFIAHARQDIPALVSEIRHLRAAAQRAEIDPPECPVRRDGGNRRSWALILTSTTRTGIEV